MRNQEAMSGMHNYCITESKKGIGELPGPQAMD